MIIKLYVLYIYLCCAQWNEPDSILPRALSVVLLTGFHFKGYMR